MAAIRGQPDDQSQIVLPPEPAPYRGLFKFKEEHATLFFGRDQEIQAVLKKLEQSSSVAVVGASGAGKSSLVLAGVVPRRGWAALPA